MQFVTLRRHCKRLVANNFFSQVNSLSLLFSKKKNPDNGWKKHAPTNLQRFIELFQCTDNLCHVWSFSGIWPQASADEVLQYLVCHLSDLTFTVFIIRECLNAHFTEENTETVDINLKSRTRKVNEIRLLFSQALCRLRRPSTLCRLYRLSTLCHFALSEHTTQDQVTQVPCDA